jgi:hypothetical protein
MGDQIERKSFESLRGHHLNFQSGIKEAFEISYFSSTCDRDGHGASLANCDTLAAQNTALQPVEIDRVDHTGFGRDRRLRDVIYAD